MESFPGMSDNAAPPSDSPTLIDTLVSRWLDDSYDVVYTAKAHRENEPLLRRPRHP